MYIKYRMASLCVVAKKAFFAPQMQRSTIGKFFGAVETLTPANALPYRSVLKSAIVSTGVAIRLSEELLESIRPNELPNNSPLTVMAPPV